MTIVGLVSLIVLAATASLSGVQLTLVNSTSETASVIDHGRSHTIRPGNALTVDVNDGKSIICAVSGLIARIEQSTSSSLTRPADSVCDLGTLLLMSGYDTMPLDSITLINDGWFAVHTKDLNPDSPLFGQEMIIEPGQEITKNAQHRSPGVTPKVVNPLYGIIGLSQDGTSYSLRYSRRRYFSNGPMTCVWLNRNVSLSTFFLLSEPESGWRYSVIKRLPKSRS